MSPDNNEESPRVKKTVALTLLLAALPLALLLPGSPGRLGGPPMYRLLVTWGVPIAAALLALLFSLRGARGLLFPGAPRTMRRLLPWCFAAFVADFSFLGAGHLLGWVTFTYGDQGVKVSVLAPQAVRTAMTAGIPDGPHACPKGLRHGFGVQAVSRGIALNMVQKWLGHAQLTTTAIYANAVGEEEQSIAARMW